MDSPVIFKRKANAVKPLPRARERSPETGTQESVEESPSTLATKLKKKIQKSKPKSKLSFGGDDEVRHNISGVLRSSLTQVSYGLGR